MTTSKSVSAILAEVHSVRSSTIMKDMLSKAKVLERCIEELNTILRGCREYDWDLPSKFDIRVGEYGYYIYIDKAQDKEAYENMLLALVDLYGEGKRDSVWGDRIEYTWTKDIQDYNKIGISLRVDTSLSGCKIVKKREYVARTVVPEKIVEAHWEEKNVLECVEND